MKNNGGEIDFVIIWVDGSDPEWQAERAKYTPDAYTDNRVERYRDWELLPYWFRGVEKFAPWVRKIHFVTWGHLPKWLDTTHPKLNIVRHSDYIPEKYLPTFSSHTIELNLHRIEGLSEDFVYFNDDMFIISPMSQANFFKNGLPCDCGILNVHCYTQSQPIQMIAIHDTGIINEHFSVKDVIKSSPFRWLDPIYGKFLLRTLPLMFCPRFPGFYQHHLPSSFMKSTYEKVWDIAGETLNKTCMNKFRTPYDVNQWIFREWQLAENNFSPVSPARGKSYFADRDGFSAYEKAAEDIIKQKYLMVSVNDSTMTSEDFQKYSLMLKNAFEKILPDRSGFEV